MPSKSTMVELVEELKQLPRTDEISLLIAQASMGLFHDWKSSDPCCKTTLCLKLDKLGLKDLTKRVVNGEFDEDF